MLTEVKTSTTRVAGIPRRLPAVAEDRWIYLARPAFDESSHTVATFDGWLDESRLQQALRLVMDAEPVFGCRYVPGRKPYWERRDDLDSLPLCALAESQDVQTELERCVATPCDATSDPLIQGTIVHGQTDTLLLKTNHVAVDGIGSLEVISLLASFYRNLSRSSQPAISPNLGSRGAEQLFRQIGWSEWLRLLSQPRNPAVESQWCFPTANCEDRSALRFAMRRLEPPAFDLLHAYGQSLDATLNDIFVAAYFRALWRFLDFPAGIPQSVAVPVDMRRLLPSGRTKAICNFTAPVSATLARQEDEAFPDTLERLKRSLLSADQRRDRALAVMLGISLACRLHGPRVEKALEASQRKSAAEGRTVACLTNLGAFHSGTFDFGVPVTDAYRVMQAAFAPSLLLGVSSFEKKLTFTITYPSLAMRSSDIERLLDTFLEELPESAGVHFTASHARNNPSGSTSSQYEMKRLETSRQ